MFAFIKLVSKFKTYISNYDIVTFQSVNDLTVAECALLQGQDKNFLLSKTYLQVIEKAFATTVTPIYIKLTHKKTGVTHIWYGQIYGFQFQHFDALQKPKPTINFFSKAIQNLFLRSNCINNNKVLILGNLLYSGSIQHIDTVLLKEIEKQLKAQLHIDAIVVKDIQTRNEDLLDAFHEIPLQPNMIMELPKHWNTIEDYVKDLQPKYKKRWNNTNNKNGALQFVPFSVYEIESNLDALYATYISVFETSETKYNKVAPTYFKAMKAALGENYQLVAVYLNQAIIGFASYIIEDKKMITEFIGYNTEYNKEYKVYQSILYFFIKEALQHKLETIELGRTGMEIKSALGAKPVYFHSYLQFCNCYIHKFTSSIVKKIEDEEWTPRHPFK